MIAAVETASPLVQITELAAFVHSARALQETDAAGQPLPTPAEWAKLPPTEGVARLATEGACAVLSAAQGAPSDADAEGFFLVLASLARKAGDPALFPAIAAAVASDPAVRTPLRLRILGNVFAALDAKSRRRADVFKALLRCALDGGQQAAVVGTLARLTEEPDEAPWLAQAAPDAKRDVLELACDVARAAGDDGLLLRALLPRFLATFEHREPRSDAAAVRAVALAVGRDDVFRLDHLLALAPVAELGAAPAPGPAALALLKVFVSGGVAEYRAWSAAHDGPATLAALGLSEDALLRKIRLLALLGVCEARTGGDVAFAEAAAALDVPEDAAEQWFVDAVAAGLVTARIDQPARKAAVTASFQREFGNEQWAMLEQRLVAWRSNLLALRGVLQQVAAARPQQLQQRQQQAAARGASRHPHRAPPQQQQS